MSKIDLDGHAVGTRMAVELIHRAFNHLAISHAAADHEGALAALVRVEIFLADALEEFRKGTGVEIDVYNDAFDAMIMTVSTLVEGAREAIERGSELPED
jgi:hypothetical protein